MAALEVIALDTSVPQLMAPQAGDTYTFPRAVEMPLGTANGVLYLDGSKVVTSGSALTFDGTNLGIGTISPASYNPGGNNLVVGGSGNFKGITIASAVEGNIYFADGTTGNETYRGVVGYNHTSDYLFFFTSASERMRLNSTGLGIGTSSPAYKLDVNGTGGVRFTGTNSNRPVTIDTNVMIKGEAGSWAVTHGFIGSSGTVRGGFGALGNDDTINYYWIGSAYDSNEFVLTSSGNLGIGTSSPGVRLEVAGSIRSSSSIFAGYASGFDQTYIGSNGATGNGCVMATVNYANNAYQPISYDASVYLWRPNGTEAMRLDASGNLGLGVTPSGWATYKAFQMGATTPFALDSSGAIGFNYYYDGAYKYFGNSSATLYSVAAGQHRWFTAASGTAGNAISFTQAMTLDASGNLEIGGTFALGRKLNVYSSADGYTVSLLQTDAFNSGKLSGTVYAGYYDGSSITDMASIRGGKENTTSGNYAGMLAFYTRPNGGSDTERARITSGGYFKASDDGTYTSSGSFHEVCQSADNVGFSIECSNASLTTLGCAYIQADRNTTNNTFYALSYYNVGAAAYKFRVADSGDVTNTNGTYGTISDAKMKTDIVDASSQWEDLKAVRFRKFRMKSDPSGLRQLGVVAQELEQVSPGLVDEHADRDAEGNDLGTTTKTVKTSVLLMKAAVALQEAMLRIEALEAKVAALEA